MNNNELSKKKACAFMQSIEKMESKERENLPTGVFGDSYNNLRDMVEEDNPELAKHLPPRVSFDNYGMDNERLSVQRYTEIGTFCRTIFELLS
jgi:hypothetical protein